MKLAERVLKSHDMNETMLLRKIAKDEPNSTLGKISQYFMDNGFEGHFKDNGKGKVAYKGGSPIEVTAGDENLWLDIPINSKNHEEFIKETAKYLEAVNKLR